jgi:hypothetical protein
VYQNIRVDVFHNKVAYIVNCTLPVKRESVASRVFGSLFEVGRQQGFISNDRELITVGQSEIRHGFAGVLAINYPSTSPPPRQEANDRSPKQ